MTHYANFKDTSTCSNPVFAISVEA